MGAQQVEKLPAAEAEETGRLALRDPALLEPMHDSGLPQFLRKSFGPDVEGFHRLLRKFDCDLSGHGGNLGQAGSTVKRIAVNCPPLPRHNAVCLRHVALALVDNSRLPHRCAPTDVVGPAQVLPPQPLPV